MSFSIDTQNCSCDTAYARVCDVRELETYNKKHYCPTSCKESATEFCTPAPGIEDRCFDDEDVSAGNNWGWSIGPISFGDSNSTHMFPVYAGAAKCNVMKGPNGGLPVMDAKVQWYADLKTLTVSLDDFSKEAKEALSEKVGESWRMNAFQVYVGNHHVKTTSPGRFTYVGNAAGGMTSAETTFNFDSDSKLVGSYNMDSNGVNIGKPIYMAIHTGACECIKETAPVSLYPLR